MARDALAAGSLAAPNAPRRNVLRRESLVLLPVSLLLFVLIAAVTLLSYRTAVERLVVERQNWCLRQATALAERASTLPAGAWSELLGALPVGSALSVVDPRGAVVWSGGRAALDGLDDRASPTRRPSELAAAVVEGPDASISAYLVAWAPFARRAGNGARERWAIRFSSPEPTIAAERRSLRLLTPAVFGLSGAVAILALAFLYRLNRPLERLLERAREAGSPALGAGKAPPRGDDEIDFLFATFDRALAALRSADSDPTGGARRDAEAKLAESVAQLGELSAGVAHELRNSLGTLQGYLGLLARRELPDGARDELAEAQQEAAALGRVVDDFLAFARPGPRALEAIDLAAVVDRALADPSLAGSSFSRLGLTGPLLIRGDERLLLRALRNLLLNAAQAQSEGSATGAVEVTLSAGDGQATVRIRDRGPGIAPEIASRLFEPFASGRPGGAGLGLALARRIALLHSGTVRLESHPEGGALAEVCLPIGD